MFILVTVQAQQFPVTPIRRIVLVVVVPMMHCEVAEFLPSKLTATSRTNWGKNFQCPSPVTFFTLVLALARLSNQFLLAIALWSLFSRHLVSSPSDIGGNMAVLLWYQP